MAVFETWLKSDLQKPVTVKQLPGNLFLGDSNSNLIGVEVTNGGNAAKLTGDVYGYILREDDETLVVQGTLDNYRASIVLPAAAYTMVGNLSIVIKVGGTTVGACVARVYRSQTDTFVDPDDIIPSVEELLQRIQDALDAAETAEGAAETAVDAKDTAVEAAEAAEAAVSGLTLIPGEIKAISGTSVPNKWLLCDGSVISRTTYNKLFQALGTTWGGGDGSTTFAIPDLQGRTIIGTGENAATGHTAHTLGQVAGEETHQLSAGEMAQHNHGSKGGHTHSFHWGNGDFNVYGSNHNETGSQTCLILSSSSSMMNSAGSHTHDNVGSNSNHNTMQPYIACQYIIYTGVNNVA